MTADDLRRLFETAREQEVEHGMQGVRVVPIVSALLKAADELDEACRLLERAKTFGIGPYLDTDIDAFLRKHGKGGE